MKYKNVLYAGSGFGMNDCCFLGQHFTEKHGFKPDHGESWVIRARPMPDGSGKTIFQGVYGVAGWLTGLWRSPSAAYVTELYGTIRICRDLAAAEAASTWEMITFPNTIMQGVWGLHDSCVFAWCKVNLEPRVFFFDGKSWTPLPPPPGEIAAMHGASPDDVVAVGASGLLARWNGKTWTQIPLPTNEFLTSVFVASPDEAYAVGHGGDLWEGSSSGWGKVATGPGVLTGVAKFAGEVWVGAHMKGLHKRERNQLVCVDPELHAQMMDARQHLLISSPESMTESRDGKSFTTKARGLLARLRDDKTPLWGYEPDDDEEAEDAEPT